MAGCQDRGGGLPLGAAGGVWSMIRAQRRPRLSDGRASNSPNWNGFSLLDGARRSPLSSWTRLRAHSALGVSTLSLAVHWVRHTKSRNQLSQPVISPLGKSGSRYASCEFRRNITDPSQNGGTAPV